MDKKQQIQLIITGILIIILIFALNYAGKASVRIKRIRNKTLHSEILTDNRNQERVGKDVHGKQTILGETLYNKLSSEAKTLSLTRNLFSNEPLFFEKKDDSEVILSGIMWDKEQPLAIINDIVVKKGDTVGGNIVVKIEEDRVILNNGESDFELKLGQ